MAKNTEIKVSRTMHYNSEKGRFLRIFSFNLFSQSGYFITGIEHRYAVVLFSFSGNDDTLSLR